MNNKIFFKDIEFIYSLKGNNKLPQFQYPEFAFLGRSNVGKSSLINKLVNRKSIARTSNTPGRTQQANYFLLNKAIALVDLPGYGYAKLSKKQNTELDKTISNYVYNSLNLNTIYLLIDARRGILDIDQHVIDIFNECHINFIIVITKYDKLKKSEQNILRDNILEDYSNSIFTISKDNWGIDDLRYNILNKLGEQ